MAPFKSSLARSAGKLFGVFRERDLSLRGATQTDRIPPPVTFSSSGGTKTTSGSDVIHAFTSNDNLTFSGQYDSVKLLLVAGGGGGASHTGNGHAATGGGGGGVVLELTGVTLDAVTMSPVVI